jgi:molecular chaperone GrpE (heat shock protein)
LSSAENDRLEFELCSFDFESTLAPMSDADSRLPIWPFLAADALFLAVAGLLLRLGHRPLLWWEALFMVACVAGAAWSMVTPFLRRNREEQSLAQARLLADSMSQLQKLEPLAAHITGATAQWREYQEQTALTAASAKAVADSMAAEVKAFGEFLQKINDTEKAHLRLETEKLRRAEQEWLQVTVHMLDHVFALFQAAQRSGQPGLIEQIGLFQNSCRDAARRVGLAPTMATAGEPFDPKAHRLKDDSAPPENAVVADTLATGYTYQGQLLRRPMVAVQEAPSKTAP